ncbi:MAG: DUF3662 and FHA domain-containing protein [Coriobacteriia bacterium]|nr:DUF3662 and FHA domain-containing protein [Coriobacteriia bacterium]
MSILSDFEDRVGRAIEGVFTGIFRSPVQPAEIARAAAKEMDRSKRLGVGKVYAPTMYSVLLSPEDADALGGFTDTIAGELETYLLGYADERDYELAHRPRVRFLVDDALRLGRFEVIGELLSPEEIAAELAEEVPASSLPVAPGGQGAEALHASDEPHPVIRGDMRVVGPVTLYDDDVFAATGDFEPAETGLTVSDRIATITVPGFNHDVALNRDRTVIGRLNTCDICLQDANASREHAELERGASGWTLVDLGSLNGTLHNGVRASRATLADGDVITIGVTELVFHEAGADTP